MIFKGFLHTVTNKQFVLKLWCVNNLTFHRGRSYLPRQYASQLHHLFNPFDQDKCFHCIHMFTQPGQNDKCLSNLLRYEYLFVNLHNQLPGPSASHCGRAHKKKKKDIRNVRNASSLMSFCCNLKTVLFRSSFSD